MSLIWLLGKRKLLLGLLQYPAGANRIQWKSEVWPFQWRIAVSWFCGYFIFWLSAGAELLWQWHCMSVPGNGMCVRCAHTAAAHCKPASCTVRPGALKRWEHCACTRYVPPGVLPEAADLSLLPFFPS